MKQSTLYVGLDVDDTQYHGSALSQETGEVLDFRCRPSLKGLVSQLGKLRKHFSGHTVQVAYEASYISVIRSNGIWLGRVIIATRWPHQAFPEWEATRSKPIASMPPSWRSFMRAACSPWSMFHLKRWSRIAT